MQEKAPDSLVSVQGFGMSTPESFARWDRDTLSWRTSQHSLLGGLETFSEPWPISGTMRNGRVSRRPMWVPPTCENESLSWPTPRANSHRNSRTSIIGGKYEKHMGGSDLGLEQAVEVMAGILPREIETPDELPPQWRARWPTPNTIGYRSDGELRLLAQACDTREEFLAMSDRAANSKRNRAWPTPTVSMHKGSSANAMTRSTGKSRENDRLDYATEQGVIANGRLNPQWVEWLMGFPSEWTVSKPSATPSSRKSRKSSGK